MLKKGLEIVENGQGMEIIISKRAIPNKIVVFLCFCVDSVSFLAEILPIVTSIIDTSIMDICSTVQNLKFVSFMTFPKLPNWTKGLIKYRDRPVSS